MEAGEGVESLCEIFIIDATHNILFTILQLICKVFL